MYSPQRENFKSMFESLIGIFTNQYLEITLYTNYHYSEQVKRLRDEDFPKIRRGN